MLFYLLLVVAILFGVQALDLPDVSQDEFPPYPPVGTSTDPAVNNYLGTRLYGWTGCLGADVDKIKEAYNDMHHIMNFRGTSGTIDWSSKAAEDFFGPGKGPHAIDDETRAEILNIFVQVQQMYYILPAFRLPKISHWIKARCSGNNGKGDPENACGDRSPSDPNPPGCPDGSTPIDPPPGEEVEKLQAYTNNNMPEAYDEITFCTGFFNLNSWQEVLAANAPGRSNRYDLTKWDCRARCFIHEATHVDFLMNAPEVNPYVQDLWIEQRKDGRKVYDEVYGVEDAKVLARYRSDDDEIPGGYYTQRSAENFAWFALANMAEHQMSHYPGIPVVRRAPIRAPTGKDGQPPVIYYSTDSTGFSEFDFSHLGPKSNPQCPDVNRTSTPMFLISTVTINKIIEEKEYTPKNIIQAQAWEAALYDNDIANVDLVILPLGDSITFGSESGDGNGYRNQLRNLLASGGNTVTYVGNLQSGTMTNNDNEGHVGATIDQIAAKANDLPQEQPNVVLLHAGSVDMLGGLELADAPRRLGNLLDTLLVHHPNALILVAQIIPASGDADQTNIGAFNNAIPGLVADRVALGSKVMAVDMFGYSVGPEDYVGLLTPNDLGYAKMSVAWHKALSYAYWELKWV